MTDYTNQQNKIAYRGSQRGFLKPLVIIIIAAVVLSFFGFSPVRLWTEVVVPIVETLWNALIAFLTFVIGLVERVMQ